MMTRASDGITPVEDKNQPNPQPLPAGHEVQTPDLLKELIRVLNEVRDERSQLLAQCVKQGKSMEAGTYKSDVVKDWERRNRERNLSDKEDELLSQIHNLMHLLPPEQRPRTYGLGIY